MVQWKGVVIIVYINEHGYYAISEIPIFTKYDGVGVVPSQTPKYLSVLIVRTSINLCLQSWHAEYPGIV